MDDEVHGKDFLEELYRRTKGDPAAQVSMYDVGATIGLSKGEAGSIAESLIVDGLVELKTLAGGIGITDEGISSLGLATPAAPPVEAYLSLSPGPIANGQDRQTVAELVRQIRQAVSGRALAYDILEEIVLDLKALELHMLSPKPKVPVLRELLRSLQGSLAAAEIRDVAAMIQAITPIRSSD